MDVIRSIPLRPAFMASHVEAKSFPIGLMQPIPVITTRLSFISMLALVADRSYTVNLRRASPSHIIFLTEDVGSNDHNADN